MKTFQNICVLIVMLTVLYGIPLWICKEYGLDFKFTFGWIAGGLYFDWYKKKLDKE